MTKTRLFLTVSLAALLASGMAVAGEIYKWIDDGGNVHYEDRPIADTEIEHMEIVSKNTDNSIVQARLDANRKAREAARQVASEAPPEMTKEEVRAEQEKRQADCQKYRDQLQSFLRSQRLYQEDDAGDRTYLSDDEVMAARTRVEGQIQEYCGS
jgi:actin-related protein